MEETKSFQPESSAIPNLKPNLRAHLKLDRTVRRNDHLDAKRIGVGEIKQLITELENITEKEIAGLASRIKRRRRADERDLTCFSLAFLQSADNICAFVNIPGALNVIVKELTGNNSKRMILACECLCNMSLGSGNCCEKVTMAAGSYLLMFLDSNNQRLAYTALWTLFNLCVSPVNKSKNILISQKILPTIMATILNNATNPEFVAQLYDMIHVTFSIDDFKDADKYSMLEQAIEDKSLSSVRLVYRLLFDCDFKTVSTLCQRIVRKVVDSVQLQMVRTTTCDDSNFEVLCLVRILGNVFALDDMALLYFVKQLQLKSLVFSDMLNHFTGCGNVVIAREVTWLAATVLSSHNEYIQYYLAKVNFLANLNLFNDLV